MAHQPIYTLAEEWLQLDRDHRTRAQINDLVEDKNEAELELRLRPRIAFGTAGLRAKTEAGFARINPLTIIQTTQGLCEYLAHQDAHAFRRGIVIGYDHRSYNGISSKELAVLTGSVFVAAGCRVYFYDELVHTPLVPFGVIYLQAACGIMITASHNPAPDNGYKVYWSNGSQIIPPHDTGIAEAILRNLEPTTWDAKLILRSERPFNRVKEAYYRSLKEELGCIPSISSSFRLVYTPMHGVGSPYFSEAMSFLGAKDCVVTVEEQLQPNATFPTVKFPNPEELGALDLAIACADKHHVDLVFATDPDADRFAAAERTSTGWKIFTGDEVGILLASFLLERYRKARPSLEKLFMLNSTVSSKELESMANAEGFMYEETLTGFKWLGNRALELQSAGYDVVFAFEEALGYMTRVIPDKDGIFAASMFLQLYAGLHGTGKSLCGRLLELHQRYGFHETLNYYYTSPNVATINNVFTFVRTLSRGGPHPTRLGSQKVIRWRDLTVGYDSSTLDHKPLLPTSPSAQMITCHLEDGVRFTARSSGTEPKIKIYIEAVHKEPQIAHRNALKTAQSLEKEWFRSEETSLRPSTTSQT